MKNPVEWFEIATVDLERAKNFYAEVFKVEFQHVPMPGAEMYMFNMVPNGAGAGGALVKSDDNTPSSDGTLVYFSCEDVDNEVSRIEGAGGKIVFPKMSIGEFGFVAQFIDTEGNRVGLHSNK